VAHVSYFLTSPPTVYRMETKIRYLNGSVHAGWRCEDDSAQPERFFLCLEHQLGDSGSSDVETSIGIRELPLTRVEIAFCSFSVLAASDCRQVTLSFPPS
jgi:hypothetical protein